MPKNDQRKTAALAALVSSRTLTEAAEKAGISRKTLYSYIRDDFDFAKAFRDLQEEIVTSAAEEAQSMTEEATDVVKEIMENDELPAALRLKAASILLEISEKRAAKLESITNKCVSSTSSPFDFSL